MEAEFMQYRQLGNSDLQCSVVAIGTWAIGGTWGGTDDEQSIAAIRAGIDAGINLLDTAPPYGNGHSEIVTGQAIKGIRDKVIIATKCGNYTRFSDNPVDDIEPGQFRKQLEASLKRLDVDYVDLYQVHWPHFTSFEMGFRELNELREEGLVRHVGVSNFSGEQMDFCAQFCPIVSLQPPYSLLDRRIEAEILPYCVEKNIGTLTYGSIAAGALTGKYTDAPTFNVQGGDPRGRFYDFFSADNWPKTAAVVEVLKEIAAERERPTVQVAINWVLKQPGVTVALVGVRTPEQAVMNAGAGNWALSDEEDARIKAAYDKIFE
jgi:aryl-alcohol dehydrogenase-like predicted oxidoreductase